MKHLIPFRHTSCSGHQSAPGTKAQTPQRQHRILVSLPRMSTLSPSARRSDPALGSVHLWVWYSKPCQQGCPGRSPCSSTRRGIYSRHALRKLSCSYFSRASLHKWNFLLYLGISGGRADTTAYTQSLMRISQWVWADIKGIIYA